MGSTNLGSSRRVLFAVVNVQHAMASAQDAKKEVNASSSRNTTHTHLNHTSSSTLGVRWPYNNMYTNQYKHGHDTEQNERKDDRQHDSQSA
jgi:hypothetical protein